MAIRVHIVEDQKEYREYLCSLLRESPGFELVGSSADLPKSNRSGIQIDANALLLDIELNGQSSLGLIPGLRHANPEMRIVILSAHCDDALIFQALAAGVDGYLHKAVTPPVELLHSLEKAIQGQSPISGSVARRIIQSFRSGRKQKTQIDSLTRRELEVLQRLADGFSNKEIAKALGVSESTIRAHVHNVLKKLPAKNRVVAALSYIQSLPSRFA